MFSDKHLKIIVALVNINSISFYFHTSSSINEILVEKIPGIMNNV